MNKYIIVIDQGTTSTRAILFDTYGQIVLKSQIEVHVFSNKSGYVEQNPEEIYETCFETIKEILNAKKVDIHDIIGLSITNQRETTILWDKTTGKAVYNAIVWQSRQSFAICDKIKEKGLENIIKDKTGLIINPYFSASKIKWIFDNNPDIYLAASKGNILFGTVDSYLLWRLTDGKIHATDISNASRTLLYNIKEEKWDDDLLQIFNIPAAILPKVYQNDHIYGRATALREINPNADFQICSLIGDQQASLFGQCSFDFGDIKNTYGTGCFMLMNTGKSIVESGQGLLSTIAWKIFDETYYALEGSVFIGGAAVSWLRDNLEMINCSDEVSEYVNDYNNKVYAVPAFVGLGTPYWDNLARGAIFGLEKDTRKADIVNAFVESIAYQVTDVMSVFEHVAKTKIKNIYVDGGASKNNYLMQFQADLLNLKIIRPECMESTALGACFLGLISLGIYKNLDEIKKLRKINKIFMSNMDQKTRVKLLDGWKLAVECTRGFKR